jgi:quinol monooxygenase YgiN
MDRRLLASFAVVACALSLEGRAMAQAPNTAIAEAKIVRIAELEIDPAQLDRYTAAVKEEMEISVRTEPGVLGIYSVAEKDNPSKLRFFEIYADEAAYQAHIQSPHFRKYYETTKTMITSRKLIETTPVLLAAKP